jgi:hypothetical protein
VRKPRGLSSGERKLFTAVVYVALNLALWGIDFDGPRELGIALFFAIPFVFGIFIGEWWAILLALTILLVAVAYPSVEEGDVDATFEAALYYGVPLTALPLAIGVTLRKVLAPP